MPYFEGTPDEWHYVQKVQQLKRQYSRISGVYAIKSDQHVVINPVTGDRVPLADLKYAARHLRQIYESGDIREDRWAFLWYH